MSSKLNDNDNVLALVTHFSDESRFQEYLFDCDDRHFNAEIYDLNYTRMWGLGHLLPPAPCPPRFYHSRMKPDGEI